jgi:hypothetical protein
MRSTSAAPTVLLSSLASNLASLMERASAPAEVIRLSLLALLVQKVQILAIWPLWRSARRLVIRLSLLALLVQKYKYWHAAAPDGYSSRETVQILARCCSR